MSPYTFHISLYDGAFIGAIFIGLSFGLQLWFTQKANQAANRFLALALAVMVFGVTRLLAIDVQLKQPLQFSLALGPLLFFYVLKITRPEHKFSWKDSLHFVPALAEQFVLPNSIVQTLAFFSVSIYLLWSHVLIKRFYKRLKFNELSDRYRYEFRWLHRLLTGFALLWLLWIPFTAIDFYYHHQAGPHIYYPLYLLLTATIICIAIVSHLRPEVSVAEAPVSRPLLRVELKQKGSWLKNAMKTGLYYQDPELSLSSLAEKLDLTTHELSRIINTVLKKSFNDFINEFRVAEVARKMEDPAYDHLTLLGIAFESGFNSKSTFNRAFRQVTGISAAEYKNELKKSAHLII